ncbi:SpaA isopeptide-forming pilin-related protein [Faecalibacterium prausnitzii]|uniref:Cna B-type domain-containing protein n=1 Tax=Faecalibacterium prausnitzii TaxID=853 RepID=A0A6A8KEV7_9FIRM|nr:SpaA isopeptide-forming pilin-related protein [Faecalibacterium prausnitzii]MSC45306.1 Cna B-type domain-containing protein [Faecalibacterium prausnitzii]MSC48598.1 Cna B-type domain-containing protein [Faecalibacterium prausnitzii]MSC68597.1 Cna B-type domain-containing protein [Faecalibacterium prausnitzii]MSC74697.1 Cna B-type domain-containing protein [Faecalibacterium prausnitzii]MSC80390.1 Cna B-type domain-containing protein [Faecalibacterium prausnitzii]
MNDILKTYMERFRENRHTLRRYTAFVLALAMITTLFVNWQLHGVGISMTAQYQCGEEEHIHTADCYTKVLTCGYEEGELENADEVAAAAATSQPTVEAEPAPLSLEPQIEFVPHEHTEDCYTEVQTLTCMEEEHVHGDDCFDPEDGSLICDKFEHTHDESCYTTEYELTCGLEEGELVEQVVEPTQSAELAAMAVAEPVALEPTVDTVEPIYHHHTDACYEEVLTCPLPEHHHTVACLSDTSADVETPEEWQAANAEAVMTGNWDEDLLSVAKTQLGYEQSEKNFEIDPADGVTLHYYSRYGQSYGNPYGEWDVMFLSYCLKYAGIPQSAIPQEASVLSLRSSMSDMDWLLDGEDGSAANVGDIVIYNKYVTRTVAVDSSADGAADDLDDQFSMDAEGENGAELETSGAAALDTAPAAEDAPAADSVITPDLPDTANPDQPAAKPVDNTGTSASGADTLIPSVGSPAAEPQTTTVTDAQPVETVGIVSEADENTLTVISGDVDGKVAEVTLSNAEVLAVVDVAAAQYADEMLTTAVTGALQAPGMLMLAGAEETASTTASASIKTALDGAPYITVFKLQKEKNKQYVDVDTSVITDQLHGYLELKDIPALKIQEHEYQVVVSLPLEFDLKDVGTHKGNLTSSDYNTADHVCGTYEFVQGEDGRWYALLTYEKDFIHQEELSEASKVDSTLGFDFKWNQEIVTTNGENKFSFNDDATVTITIKEDESTKPGEQKKYSLDKKSSGLKYDGKDAYIYYTVTLKLKEAMDAPLELKDILKNPDGYPLFKYDGDIAVTVSDGSTPSISWKDTKITDGGKEYDGKIITLGTEGTPLNPGTYTITYHVKAENFGTASYPDKDVRNYIKFEKDSKGTATSIKTKEIEKKGELDKDGQTIKWTVTINRDSVRRYLPEGTKFTDEIPKGQKFVKDSFNVKKTDASGKEEEFKKLQGVYDESTNTLTYALDAGFNYYKITYKTKVTDSIPLTGLDVSNTGNVDGDGLDGSSEGTVHIDSNVLAKKAVGEPSITGTNVTMKWISTINAEDVSTYVYYDYSNTVQDTEGKNRKAQEIDLNSIKVTDQNGAAVSVTPVAWSGYRLNDDYGKNLGLFMIDFRGITVTWPLTITYTTTTTTSDLPSWGAEEVKNTCYINNGSHITAKQKVTKASDMIKYFYKYAGEFNWNNVQNGNGSTTLQPGAKLPWTIEINEKGILEWINDDKWVITDTIPKGLVLDENSVKINCNGSPPPTGSYKVAVNKLEDGSTKLVITMEPEAFSYTDNGKKKIQSRIFITYDTTLDTTCHDIWDENNTAKFTNHATFERKGEKIGDTEFTETVTRDVVGKSGTFDAATGLLTYQVKVNPYGATLNNGNEMLLEDVMTIPEGLYGYVTLEGITVFDGELQADGSLEAAGVPTDLTLVSTVKDLSDSIAKKTVTTDTYYSKIKEDKKLTTWTKVADGKALVLVFHYRVDTTNLVANKTYTFKNKAKLNDHWTYEDKNTSFTSSSDASANINYNNSRLTIVKYSGTQSNVLAGAKFKLQKFGKDNGTWVSVKINGKDEITTNARGNETIGGLDPDTLYCLTETEAPAGYLLPSPNKPYYFAISHESTYTPPVGSGITEIDKLYQLKADQKVGSFYYYCNNTPDETYVLPGKLKVVKKWTDASGNLLTDLRNVPSVTVTLTKSAPATGHTIKVVTAGQTEKEYCTDIRDGAYIYIGSMGNNSELFNQVKASLPSGVTIETTNRADNCYKIGPIKSNFTITSQSLYYNCTNQAGFVEQEEGTEISTEPVVTTVGTVTLNALNKWTYTWDDLETGDGITYSITEETVTGYKTTYTVTVDGTEKTDTSATAIPIDPNKGTLVTITNAEETPGYELPSTGGTGTLPYTAVGGTMMLTALAYSFIHRKRRREGRADD